MGLVISGIQLCTELKILANVLADSLRPVLLSLNGPEQICIVKGLTIQTSFFRYACSYNKSTVRPRRSI